MCFKQESIFYVNVSLDVKMLAKQFDCGQNLQDNLTLLLEEEKMKNVAYVFLKIIILIICSKTLAFWK